MEVLGHQAADNILEAQRSAGDILQDLKDLYASVRGLQESLVAIQDVAQELLELLGEGLSIQMLAELAEVVQDQGPRLVQMIKHAAGVLKKAWEHRHRVRGVLTCDKRNNLETEEDQIRAVEGLTVELEQAGNDMESARFPLLQAMSSLNPLQRLLKNERNRRIRRAEENLRMASLSVQAHIQNALGLGEDNEIAGPLGELVEREPRQQAPRNVKEVANTISTATAAVKQSLLEVRAAEAVTSFPVPIHDNRWALTAEQRRDRTDAASKRALPGGQTLHSSMKAVNAVAVSPDGKLLASGGAGRVVRVWRFLSARLLDELRVESSVLSISWSSDSQKVVIATSDNSMTIWNITTDHRFKLNGDAESVNCVAWSPDGRRIATAASAGAIEIWNARSGQLVYLLAGHNGRVSSIAWSPDSKKLVSGGSDMVAIMWDAETGVLLRTLGRKRITRHKNAVTSLAWSPDGSRILTGSRDQTAALWDIKTGNRLSVFRGHTKSITSVAWRPQGNMLATSSEDGSTILWRVRGLERVRRLYGKGAAVTSVSWGSDGRFFVTGATDGTTRVYSTVIA